MIKPVLAVIGPTASGKSEFAVSLAERLNGEIVNVDSVQLTRDAVIGAAQPSPELKRRVPHHLFQVVDGGGGWDAAHYAAQATKVSKEIGARDRIAILCGGSGLYLRAFLHGLSAIDELLSSELIESVTQQIDAEFAADAESQGQEFARCALYRRLKDEDEGAAACLQPRDSQRVRRALVIKRASGRSIREFYEQSVKEIQVPAFVVVLQPERSGLYERINRRVEEMWASGMLAETEELMRNYGAEAPILRALGYRHVQRFISGGYGSTELMREEWQRDTRHFAKRQLTWCRTQPSILGWKRTGEIKTSRDVSTFEEIWKNLEPPVAAFFKTASSRRTIEYIVVE